MRCNKIVCTALRGGEGQSLGFESLSRLHLEKGVDARRSRVKSRRLQSRLGLSLGSYSWSLVVEWFGVNKVGVDKVNKDGREVEQTR